MNQLAEFDGDTYIPELDRERLKTLFERVFDAMKNGHWYTLRQLSVRTGGSEASVSARIRDFRKEKFGEYEVLRKREDSGLHYYRLVVGQGEMF
jgi:hypothetical protein